MLEALRDVIEVLDRERPCFHGPVIDGAVNLKLHRGALGFLAERLQPGMRTLETGSGYSTVLFAVAGATHTAVSPLAIEHERIATWLEARNVDLSRVTFHASPSQVALPAMDPGPLDLVLIDGDHAFPAPLIDWYYLSEHIVVGGIVVVDDTNITSGKILRDFLASETPRWRRVAEFKKTAAFEKTSAPSVRDIGWPHQPYCARKLRFPRLSRWLRPVSDLLWLR